MQSFKICIFILILFGFKAKLLAQTANITGRLTDSVNFNTVAYSSISIIGFTDSLFYYTGYSKDNGSFEAAKIPYGKYILMLTRPGYADLNEIIIADTPQKDKGTFYMLLKENLLKEVVINEWSHAIRIKGDTTEFLADSFIHKANANVEDLLKKLPGIQVDRDGKITAQGETVKRVLVDGEEFFGDDPTIATRNLKAENVEKVQVFDSRSEQSILTGVEDGQKEKTINLTLKEDAKKGYFGKARAAYGPSENIDRFENEAMINSFNAKRKLSAFGTFTNTNQTGLNWNDAERFAGGMGEVSFNDEDGSISTTYTTGNDDMLARSGIPKTGYAGAFYSNKFNQGKQALNGSINYKSFNVGGFDNNVTKYILPDTVYFNNDANTFNINREIYNFSSRFDLKPDSMSTLSFTVKGNVSSGSGISRFNTQNLNGLAQLVNNNSRTDSSTNNSKNADITTYYSRRFKTKGRSVSANFSFKYNDADRDGFINSVTRFYGTNDSLNTFNQMKLNNTNNNDISGKFTYSEPIIKDWFLISDYTFSAKLNNTENSTFEKQGADYNFFVDSLSNNFNYNVLMHQGGLNIKHAGKKLSFSFGGKVAYTDLVQIDLLKKTQQNQPFYNFFPNANINYKIKNTSNLSVNYNGSTRQPSLQQIQPLQDNSNPLVLYLGNTNLVQSFTNNIWLNYNSYAPMKGRGFFARLSFNQTNNAFTNFDVVNANGVREYKTVNVNGNFSFNGFSYIYFDIKDYNLSLSIQLNGSYANNNNFVNGIFNNNKNANIGSGVNLNYELEDVFDIDLGYNINYNSTVSSLRKDIPVNFYTTEYNANISIYGLWGINFEPSLNYNYRQQTKDFNRNFNVLLLNAKIYKRFTKSKAIEASVFAYDILNRNIGFNRTANSNFISENTFVILQRYVLFGLTYYLSGGAGKKIIDDEDY